MASNNTNSHYRNERNFYVTEHSQPGGKVERRFSLHAPERADRKLEVQQIYCTNGKPADEMTQQLNFTAQGNVDASNIFDIGFQMGRISAIKHLTGLTTQEGSISPLITTTIPETAYYVLQKAQTSLAELKKSGDMLTTGELGAVAKASADLKSYIESQPLGVQTQLKALDRTANRQQLTGEPVPHALARVRKQSQITSRLINPALENRMMSPNDLKKYLPPYEELASAKRLALPPSNSRNAMLVQRRDFLKKRLNLTPENIQEFNMTELNPTLSYSEAKDQADEYVDTEAMTTLNNLEFLGETFTYEIPNQLQSRSDVLILSKKPSGETKIRTEPILCEFQYASNFFQKAKEIYCIVEAAQNNLATGYSSFNDAYMSPENLTLWNNIISELRAALAETDVDPLYMHVNYSKFLQPMWADSRSSPHYVKEIGDAYIENVDHYQAFTLDNLLHHFEQHDACNYFGSLISLAELRELLNNGVNLDSHFWDTVTNNVVLPIGFMRHSPARRANEALPFYCRKVSKEDQENYPNRQIVCTNLSAETQRRQIIDSIEGALDQLSYAQDKQLARSTQSLNEVVRLLKFNQNKLKEESMLNEVIRLLSVNKNQLDAAEAAAASNI